MSDKCKTCPLLFCDIINLGCLLTPKEIARTRPDLVRPMTRSQIYYRNNKAAIQARRNKGVARPNDGLTKYQRYYQRHWDEILDRNREANNAASRRYRERKRAEKGNARME